MSQQSEKSHRRLSEIDGLRGIAALGVTLFHYTDRMQKLVSYDAGYAVLFSVGELGVHLFFIISGFVIYMSLQGSSPSSFFVSRFTRIMPALWFCVTFTYLAKVIFGLPEWLPGRDNNFVEYLINLTMLAGAFDVKYVDGVYWTLTVELWFYILIGLVYFTRLRSYVYSILVLWIVGSVITQAVIDPALASYMPRILVAVAHHMKHFLLMSQCQLFVAGICFFHLWTNGKSRRWTVLLLTCLVLAIVRAERFYPLNFVIVLWFAAFWGAINGYLRFLSWKPLVFFGAISYPLYLVHNYPGLIALEYLHAQGWNMNLALVVVLCGATATAAFVTYHVENPLRPKLRNGLRSLGRMLGGFLERSKPGRPLNAEQRR